MVTTAKEFEAVYAFFFMVSEMRSGEPLREMALDSFATTGVDKAYPTLRFLADPMEFSQAYEVLYNAAKKRGDHATLASMLALLHVERTRPGSGPAPHAGSGGFEDFTGMVTDYLRAVGIHRVSPSIEAHDRAHRAHRRLRQAGIPHRTVFMTWDNVEESPDDISGASGVFSGAIEVPLAFPAQTVVNALDPMEWGDWTGFGVKTVGGPFKTGNSTLRVIVEMANLLAPFDFDFFKAETVLKTNYIVDIANTSTVAFEFVGSNDNKLCLDDGFITATNAGANFTFMKAQKALKFEDALAAKFLFSVYPGLVRFMLYMWVAQMSEYLLMKQYFPEC